VKVGHVRPGDLVAISGIGGLGHLALQYAKIFGGTVAAIDITDEKLQLAKDLGADLVIDARAEDPAKVHPGRNIPALNGVSFSIQPGERIALTGRTGGRRRARVVLLYHGDDTFSVTVREDRSALSAYRNHARSFAIVS